MFVSINKFSTKQRELQTVRDHLEPTTVTKKDDNQGKTTVPNSKKDGLNKTITNAKKQHYYQLWVTNAYEQMFKSYSKYGDYPMLTNIKCSVLIKCLHDHVTFVTRDVLINTIMSKKNEEVLDEAAVENDKQKSQEENDLDTVLTSTKKQNKLLAYFFEGIKGTSNTMTIFEVLCLIYMYWVRCDNGKFNCSLVFYLSTINICLRPTSNILFFHTALEGNLTSLPYVSIERSSKLVRDLYTSKVTTLTLSLFEEDEMLDPFPPNKTFEEFLDFVKSDDSRDFMIDKINKFCPDDDNDADDITEEQIDLTTEDKEHAEVLVIDENVIEMTPLPSEPITVFPLLPTVITTKSETETEREQKIDNRDDSGKSALTKRKGKRGGGGKKKSSSDTTTDASVTPPSENAVPLNNKMKLENGMDLLDTFKVLHYRYLQGLEKNTDDKKFRIAVEKEIRNCVTSKTTSTTFQKYSATNATELIESHEVGSRINDTIDTESENDNEDDENKTVVPNVTVQNDENREETSLPDLPGFSSTTNSFINDSLIIDTNKDNMETDHESDSKEKNIEMQCDATVTSSSKKESENQKNRKRKQDGTKNQAPDKRSKSNVKNADDNNKKTAAKEKKQEEGKTRKYDNSSYKEKTNTTCTTK